MSHGAAKAMQMIREDTAMSGLRRPILSEMTPEMSEVTSDTTMMMTDMVESTAAALTSSRPM